MLCLVLSNFSLVSSYCRKKNRNEIRKGHQFRVFEVNIFIRPNQHRWISEIASVLQPFMSKAIKTEIDFWFGAVKVKSMVFCVFFLLAFIHCNPIKLFNCDRGISEAIWLNRNLSMRSAKQSSFYRLQSAWFFKIFRYIGK